MPVFEYTALDIKGKKLSGIIDAESPFAARQKIRQSKNFPVAVKEVHDEIAKKDAGKFMSIPVFNSVKPAEISVMTRQLATLLGSGFPLVSALDSLIPQTGSKPLKKILAGIKDSIVEGNSFAGALSQYPKTFPALYINMVKAGETSGTLETTLERLAETAEKQQALNNRIKTALAYPVLMSFIGGLVLFLLLAFIVPNITKIFSDMNQVLPVPTRFLIATSDFFKSFWWIIFIFLGGLWAAKHTIEKTHNGRRTLDKAKLYLPGVGSLIKKLSVARFARTLGSLLENGVSMLVALETVKNIVGNLLISEAIENAAQEVAKGQGLGVSLSSSGFFPSLSVQMIQVGEQSGALENMLNKIADIYENEVESTIMGMTSLLEPVMILIMGVVVGLIVLAICLPIFEMNQLVM